MIKPGYPNRPRLFIIDVRPLPQWVCLQMRISIDCQRKGAILITALIGRVDSNNANEFQKMMEAEIAPEDKALIMDFEQVSYISSAGLRVVVVMAKKFKGGRTGNLSFAPSVSRSRSCSQ